MTPPTLTHPLPTTTFAAFRSFVEQDRTTLVRAIAFDLHNLWFGESDSPDDTFVDQAASQLDAYLSGLEQPHVVPTLVHQDVVAAIERGTDLARLLRIFAIYRRQLIGRGVQAVAHGVDGAAEAVAACMALIDHAEESFAELHRNRLSQSIQQQSDELRATKHRLEQSLSNTPLATIEWNTHGTILFWNRSAERMFGWSSAEAVGQNIVKLLVPDMALEHVQGVVDLLLSGNVAHSRNQNLTKSRGLITCQWHNAVLRDESGQVVGALSQTEDVSEQVQAEHERATLQQQVIDAQSAALRELSTPLIPLAEGVVAMPLIGGIDSNRAQQVIEHLLEGVSLHQARTVILDITGVPIVDTQVANGLLRAAQAVKLLGARVVLTGIRPEVAQTLVGLGVDLRGITTRSTLQSGIAYAFAQR